MAKAPTADSIMSPDKMKPLLALSKREPVQAAIGRVDKDLALTRIQTLDEVAEESMVQPRFRAVLASAFGIAPKAPSRM